MRRLTRFGPWIAAFALWSGCADRPGEEAVATPIPEQDYIEIMAEFSRIRRRPPTARTQVDRDRLADSMRSEILAARGVTAEQMLAFADAVGSDPVRMQRISESIAAWSDSLDAELRVEASEDADSMEAAPEPTEADDSTVVPPGAVDTAPDVSRGDEVPPARFADPVSMVPGNPDTLSATRSAADTSGRAPAVGRDTADRAPPPDFQPSRQPRPRP